MKKLLAVFAMCAAAGMAADWTGYIIDKTCSGKKEMWGDEACAKRCLARGDAAVLVTEDGKIYNVANQEKVKESAGKVPQPPEQRGQFHHPRRVERRKRFV